MDSMIFHRTESTYSDESRFCMSEQKDFNCQYAKIYAARLELFKPFLKEEAKRRWGENVNIKTLSELKDDEECAIIGTLFKQMVLKPSVLKELSEEYHLVPQPIREKYTDSSDSLILEDDVQRIVLAGDVDAKNAVTGAVVVAKGKQESTSGKFIVKEISYKTIEVKDPLPVINDDKYVVFVSGLEIGGGNESEKGDIDQHLFGVDLLTDLMNGSLGDTNIQEKMSKVVRIIVSGNSLGSSVLNKEAIVNSRGKKQQNKLQAKGDEKDAVEAMRNLDDFFFKLAVNCDIDVMPGPNDPTTFTFPQKPLHPCLFPRSSTLTTFHLVSNPYECEISGVKFLGSSGQPVRDITKVTELENHLEVLEKTLTLGHIAPTAPDTLGCFPYPDSDPFCITSYPHVYFSGCSDSFEWKRHRCQDGRQKILLVTIPTFRTTKTAVMLNLRTLQCEAIATLV